MHILGYAKSHQNSIDFVAIESKHSFFHIYSIKNLATGLPVAKTLIEYNRNN